MRVEQCFAAIDCLDADAVASFFANNAVVRLPGLPPLTGKSAIRRAFVQFSLAVEEMRHQVVLSWTRPRVTVFEADLTVTLVGGAAIALPVTYVLRWVDGVIEDARLDIYLESRLALAISSHLARH
jgi:hypothetical protein